MVSRLGGRGVGGGDCSLGGVAVAVADDDDLLVADSRIETDMAALRSLSS